VRSHRIHMPFTLLLAMFLYKAWWRSYWAKRCSSFVTTYCYAINILDFHGGFYWLTVSTDAAADIWPLLVSANQSSSHEDSSVSVVWIPILNIEFQATATHLILFTAVNSVVSWVTIPFLRGTQCLHYLSSWIWGRQIPLKFW
jgi:hypothetical protein